MAERGSSIENGLRGTKCPPSSTLPVLLGLAVFHLLPLPPSAVLSLSHALAPSHAPSCLCTLSHLVSCFSTHIPYDSSKNSDFSRPTRVCRSSLLGSNPKVPAPSRPRSAPSPAVCLKVWVTLGPRRVIQNVSSCCCPGTSQPAFSPDLSSGLVTRGPPPGPSPLDVRPPAPDSALLQ